MRAYVSTRYVRDSAWLEKHLRHFWGDDELGLCGGNDLSDRNCGRGFHKRGAAFRKGDHPLFRDHEINRPGGGKR